MGSFVLLGGVQYLTMAAPHPQDPYMINVGLTPFTTTASALSLLLVFRTNASYDRWWEARKVSDPPATCESHHPDSKGRSRAHEAACPCAKGSRWCVRLSATTVTIRRSSYRLHHRCR